MRLVFLTSKCSRAAELLSHMKNRGIAVEAILILRPNRYEMVRSFIKRVGIVRATTIASSRVLVLLAPWKTDSWLRDAFYHAHANRVCIVDDFNGEQCEQLLTELEPEIVALGCSPILRGSIIDIPKIGILNAHPGLLPRYRGVDAIPWAIYNGDDIGVTVHFIDRGVDTGPIVTQRVINVQKKDTIESLWKKADAVAAELLSDAISRILQRDRVPTTLQSIDDGKQYCRMPSELLRETRRRLRERTGKLVSS